MRTQQLLDKTHTLDGKHTTQSCNIYVYIVLERLPTTGSFPVLDVYGLDLYNTLLR